MTSEKLLALIAVQITNTEISPWSGGSGQPTLGIGREHSQGT